jgi:hypothetical protein
MSVKRRVWVFGLFAGLLWSIVPSLLFKGFNSVHTFLLILFPSILTGLLVSAFLYRPLAKLGNWSSFVFGVLALPFGAFIFGFLFSIAQLYFGTPDNSGWNAVEYGFFLAAYSLFTVLAFFFLPASIIFTFLFRRYLLYGHLFNKD